MLLLTSAEVGASIKSFILHAAHYIIRLFINFYMLQRQAQARAPKPVSKLYANLDLSIIAQIQI